MATKKKVEESEVEQKEKGEPFDPEKCRRLRMAYDKEVKDGAHPKDVRHIFAFEGTEYNMGFAHYMLEYFETCVFWVPQSRVYNVPPKLDPIESDKS